MTSKEEFFNLFNGFNVVSHYEDSQVWGVRIKFGNNVYQANVTFVKPKPLYSILLLGCEISVCKTIFKEEFIKVIQEWLENDK